VTDVIAVDLTSSVQQAAASVHLEIFTANTANTTGLSNRRDRHVQVRSKVSWPTTPEGPLLTLMSCLALSEVCCTTKNDEILRHATYGMTSFSKKLPLPIMLFTKVDVQCAELATDDRRQFITLSVHLS